MLVSDWKSVIGQARFMTHFVESVHGVRIRMWDPIFYIFNIDKSVRIWKMGQSNESEPSKMGSK